MIEEKVCPFMSRGFIAFMDENGDCETGLHHIYCQKERCMAWGECGRNAAASDPIIIGCKLIP